MAMDLQAVFDGPPSTLEELLLAREERAKRQREWFHGSGTACLISFTMNLPGEVKRFTLARRGFAEGLSAIKQAADGLAYLREGEMETAAGNEALILLDAPPLEVKRRTVLLEDAHPLGRLFDIDVLDSSGKVLSRADIGEKPRQCLLCGNTAHVCARSRAHALEAVMRETARILYTYFADKAADRVAAMAVRALLYEVCVTPKPGLVDRDNSGAHHDMDIFTFLDSGAALSPWFRDMYRIGYDNGTHTPQRLFDKLRYAGQGAEQAMFRATGGINTHKGLVFSMGLICGALGALEAGGEQVRQAEQVAAFCADLAQPTLTELEQSAQDGTPRTAGERLFLAHGVTGIRGEAAAGFPSVMRYSLPAMRELIKRGYPLNDAAAVALLCLIAHVDDTNVMHRAGIQASKEIQAQAKGLLDGLTQDNFRGQMQRLDREYIEKGVSPGGCADLLAVTLLLLFLETG